jgi:hypothetical protein
MPRDEEFRSVELENRSTDCEKANQTLQRMRLRRIAELTR